MFEKEKMICGLRRQHQLLSDAIRRLEGKPHWDAQDLRLYDERSKLLERNLKKMRENWGHFYFTVN